MLVLGIASGVLVFAGFLWTARVIWYALSGQFDIDQRLSSISK
jgi:hypothetical protein